MAVISSILVLYSEDDRGKLYILPSTGLVSPETYIEALERKEERS